MNKKESKILCSTKPESCRGKGFVGNKRGQGLSTNAIILIILGVVVLVVLIAGFSIGWGALKDRLIGTKSNVDTISQACVTACSTNSVYDYCNMKRELRDEDGKALKNVTCYYLSENMPKYGIAKCSSVDCASIVQLEKSCAAATTDKGKVSQIFDEGTQTLKHEECK